MKFKFKWFKFNGELYTVEGITVNSNPAVALKLKKKRITYKYDCNITGETYAVSQKAENPEELMSINAWYELNPDEDDRPEDIKKRVSLDAEALAQAQAAAEEL